MLATSRIGAGEGGRGGWARTIKRRRKEKRTCQQMRKNQNLELDPQVGSEGALSRPPTLRPGSIPLGGVADGLGAGRVGSTRFRRSGGRCPTTDRVAKIRPLDTAQRDVATQVREGEETRARDAHHTKRVPSDKGRRGMTPIIVLVAPAEGEGGEGDLRACGAPTNTIRSLKEGRRTPEGANATQVGTS